MSGGEGYGAYFFGLGLAGICYVGFICCRIVDLKALVAYSSVAHMGLVICGVCRYYLWGFVGALILMVAHGVCSSGLFCAVNIYYERRGRRLFLVNKGLIRVLPLFTLLFFLLCAGNIAAPPTINLFSEISLFGSLLCYDRLILLLLPIGSYLRALFTLLIFSYSQHGKNFIGLDSFFTLNYRELGILLLHVIPINMLILGSDFFSILS